MKKLGCVILLLIGFTSAAEPSPQQEKNSTKEESSINKRFVLSIPQYNPFFYANSQVVPTQLLTVGNDPIFTNYINDLQFGISPYANLQRYYILPQNNYLPTYEPQIQNNVVPGTPQGQILPQQIIPQQQSLPQQVLPRRIVPQQIIPQKSVPYPGVQLNSRILPQQVVPQQGIVSQQIIPQSPVPQRVVPQQIFPQRIIQQQVVPQQAIPQQQIFPQQVAPQQIFPQRIVPQQIVPQQVAPQQVFPQRIVPQQVVPQRVLPQQVVPQQIAPQQIFPQRVPQQIVPQQVAPQQIFPQRIVPQQITPQQIIPQQAQNNIPTFQNQQIISQLRQNVQPVPLLAQRIYQLQPQKPQVLLGNEPYPYEVPPGQQKLPVPATEKQTPVYGIPQRPQVYPAQNVQNLFYNVPFGTSAFNPYSYSQYTQVNSQPHAVYVNPTLQAPGDSQQVVRIGYGHPHFTHGEVVQSTQPQSGYLNPNLYTSYEGNQQVVRIGYVHPPLNQEIVQEQNENGPQKVELGIPYNGQQYGTPDRQARTVAEKEGLKSKETEKTEK